MLNGRPIQPPEVEEIDDEDTERGVLSKPDTVETPLPLKPRRFEVRRFNLQERRTRPLSR